MVDGLGICLVYRNTTRRGHVGRVNGGGGRGVNVDHLFGGRRDFGLSCRGLQGWGDHFKGGGIVEMGSLRRVAVNRL